jgi:hypothetical protein
MVRIARGQTLLFTRKELQVLAEADNGTVTVLNAELRIAGVWRVSDQIGFIGVADKLMPLLVTF